MLIVGRIIALCSIGFFVFGLFLLAGGDGFACLGLFSWMIAMVLGFVAAGIDSVLKHVPSHFRQRGFDVTPNADPPRDPP